MNYKILTHFKAALLPAAISVSLLLFFTFLFGLHLPTIIDFLFCLFLIVLLHVFSKKNVLWIFNSAQVLVLFYILGAMKLQYFGEPATPADIVSLAALYGLQTQGIQWLVDLVILVLLGLFFSNLQYSKRLFVSFAFAVGAFYSVIVLGSAASPLSQYVNELSRSKSVVLRQYLATVQFYDEWIKIPDHLAVAAARKKITSPVDSSVMLDGAQKRDVYLVVVESLWNPSLLGSMLAQDPLHKKFRQLWEQSGESYVLGPTFGGGTANSEFEILCGIALNSGFVVFEHPLLDTELPCLPNILGDQGYLSVASHPNYRNFWNREEAYPSLGFERYYSINDFSKDELVGSDYLSDSNLYHQHTNKTRGERSPIFHYILTISAHYPYMNTANLIELQNPVAESRRLLDSYVGLIERGTTELYDYISTVRQRDGDALIVVVGDHPPLFGKDFAIYREAGLVANEKRNMSVDELVHIYSSPLLVVDGVNGPVAPKIKSMHEIPSMIIHMLSCYQEGCVDTAAKEYVHYRPVSQRGLLYYMDGEWRLCENSDSGQVCSNHLAWLESMKIIRNATILGSLSDIPSQR